MLPFDFPVALPNDSPIAVGGVPGFCPENFAAVGAGDPPRKEGCFLRLAGSILFFSPLDFHLNGVKGFRRNDGFMGAHCVVAGQLAMVFSGNFRQVVFPKFCLEKKVPGVSIVAENALHGAFVECAAVLCNIAAFVQPLGDDVVNSPRTAVGKHPLDTLEYATTRRALGICVAN